MRATRDQVRKVLETAKPFLDDLRMEWATAMIRTAPGDAERREDYYRMIAGLNGLERVMTTYATGSEPAAPTEADPDVERDWYGNPLKEDGNG